MYIYIIDQPQFYKMNRINLFSALLTLVTTLPLGSVFLDDGASESMNFSGFIVEDHQFEKVFYLQDIEGGDVIELHFENEDLLMLDFREFEKVEVYGLYNKSANKLTVGEIELE